MDDEIVEKIKAKFLSGHFPEAEVQHLFTLFRKLLERIKPSERAKFYLLNFYCDWTLHSAIDRSQGGAEILLKMHGILHDHLQRTDNSSFGHDVSAAMSLTVARDQAIALLKRFGGYNVQITPKKWHEIVVVLAEIISHCPIKLNRKDKRFAQYLKAAEAKPLRNNSIVEEVQIVKVPSKQFDAKAPDGEITYCVKLTTSELINIITPLVGIS